MMSHFLKAALQRLFGSKLKEQARANIDNPQVQAGKQAKETETSLSLTIWTIAHNRYAASRALCTEIEIMPSEAVDLHEGIQGYVLNTPSGEAVVVEARTGSLVGHSLEIVRDGVREMSKLQLNNQLDTAKREFNRMQKTVLSNENFWKEIKMGGSEIELAQDYQE